jgi:hypothetical protein
MKVIGGIIRDEGDWGNDKGRGEGKEKGKS